MLKNRGELAHKFWKNANNSRLAPAEVYQEQRDILITYIMPYFKAGHRLLDIGCSDGEFTELLSRDSSYTLGIDLSDSLIAQAKKCYTTSPILHFAVADIVNFKMSAEFNVISCMGLFTFLTQHADFKRTISHIMTMLQPGGYLVLKDSLMLNGNVETYFNNDSYEAIYRAEADYLKAFTCYGLKVEQRHSLRTAGQANQVAIIFLLHRPLVALQSLIPKNMTKTKIAILYQVSESWGNVRSVWLAAKARPEVDVVVVLLPFFHPQLAWRRAAVERQLQNESIDYVCWDEFELTDAAFDIVIYTSPYDSTRPKSYQFSELQHKVAVTAYIPYGLEVGGGAENLVYQYGQPVTIGATAVFVRSLGVKTMFEKYCPTGAKHVVVSGHPRMDAMVNLASFDVDPQLIEKIAGRKAILWNAHFSFDGNQWSTFDIFAFEIFKAILQQQELVLIFRPHPLFWKKLVNLGIFDNDEIEQFKAELDSLGIIVDERPDHRHAFAASSALMTDAGSFLLEYLVTEKPILYLCNNDGPGLNDEGEAVIRHCRKAISIHDVTNFIENISSEIDAGLPVRQIEIEEFFEGFDGLSGHRVLEHLLCVHNHPNEHGRIK